MVTITSQQNPLIQTIKRAVHKNQAAPGGVLVAEGPHLLAEALRGLWEIEQVLVSSAARARHGLLIDTVNAPVLDVAESVLAAIADTATTQGIVTLLKPREWAWADLLSSQSLIVVFESVQDPGNVGTIIRSAEAFGATGILLLRGTAQLSNGKTLRAAAGSIFRMPYLDGLAASEARALLRDSGIACYGLTAGADRGIDSVDLTQSCALIVGNEGSGISAEMLSTVEGIAIRTAGVESLNAGIACSIALYEARRQRSTL